MGHMPQKTDLAIWKQLGIHYQTDVVRAVGMGTIAPWEHEVKRQEKGFDIRSLEHELAMKTVREVEGEQEKAEPVEKWTIVSKSQGHD